MRSSALLFCLLLMAPLGADEPEIDPASGLVMAPGWELVRANCQSCHSLQLVTQNHMSEERWATTIDWMQAKQGLWELGEMEGPIIRYLADHYGADQSAPMRRRPLSR